MIILFYYLVSTSSRHYVICYYFLLSFVLFLLTDIKVVSEEARALADAMHARELASVESLETMKKTVVRLEKELDARKRAGDDDA